MTTHSNAAFGLQVDSLTFEDAIAPVPPVPFDVNARPPVQIRAKGRRVPVTCTPRHLSFATPTVVMVVLALRQAHCDNNCDWIAGMDHSRRSPRHSATTTQPSLFRRATGGPCSRTLWRDQHPNFGIPSTLQCRRCGMSSPTTAGPGTRPRDVSPDPKPTEHEGALSVT